MKSSRGVGLLGWVLALGAVAACADADSPAYVFRSAPPDMPTSTNAASASTGVLTGKIYLADAETLDPKTGLPLGYRLLDGEAKVSVRVTTTRRTLNGTVGDGGYRVTGLPIGVPLEVTAGRTGTVSKTQVVTMPPSGQGRLNFAYGGGANDSYLVGPPSYTAPGVKESL